MKNGYREIDEIDSIKKRLDSLEDGMESFQKEKKKEARVHNRVLTYLEDLPSKEIESAIGTFFSICLFGALAVFFLFAANSCLQNQRALQVNYDFCHAHNLHYYESIDSSSDDNLTVCATSSDRRYRYTFDTTTGELTDFVDMDTHLRESREALQNNND